MAWRTCSSEQMGFDEGFLKVSLLIIRAMLACIIIPRLGPNYKAVLLKPPQSHHVPPGGPQSPRKTHSCGQITRSREVSRTSVTEWGRPADLRAELETVPISKTAKDKHI